MRSVIAAIVLLVPALAIAQEVGDEVVLGEDVRSLRFPDADVTGPTFDEGDSVTVLFVTGDRLRVWKGNDFGWINASAIAAPAGQEDATLDDE